MLAPAMMQMPQSPAFSDQTWDDLLTLIEMHKVIPVIGRALSFVDVGNGETASLQSVLVPRLASQLGIDYTKLAPGSGLNELYVETLRRNEVSPELFHSKLRRLVLSCAPALEPLTKLAEITDFRLYITTAFDTFMETAIKAVREPRGEHVQSLAFAPDRFVDLPSSFDEGSDVFVFKILGGVETCPRWAVTVEQALDFVFGLQKEKSRPPRLFDVFKDRQLLAIGCQIPDWLGRFFLFCIRGGPISRGTHFLIENQADEDRAFATYLQQFSQRAYVVSSDAVAFVEELNSRWKARQQDRVVEPSRPAVVEQSDAPHKVFLSYCHEDRSVADTLCDFLRKQRVDVWQDEEIEKGANWEKDIERQIEECACFVPLISKETGRRTESFFWQEWNQAVRRRQRTDLTRRRFIFPVLAEPGVELPDLFEDSQYACMSSEQDLLALAESLRKEQQSYRKEMRVGSI